DRIVAPVGTGVAGQSIKLILALTEIGGERAQPVGALMKGQLAQAGAADLSRVPGHACEIQSGTRGARDNAAVHRAGNIGKNAGRLDPAVERQALQGGHHRSSRFISVAFRGESDARVGIDTRCPADDLLAYRSIQEASRWPLNGWRKPWPCFRLTTSRAPVRRRCGRTMMRAAASAWKSSTSRPAAPRWQ